MSGEYRIEPISEGRFPSLIPLMHDAFGDNVDVEFFRWKYFKNPAGPVIGNIALAENSEVAAFYGMIPEVYRWGGETLRLYQSCDTMTHSRHRRKGLFQRLALQTYAEGAAADPNFLRDRLWRRDVDAGLPEDELADRVRNPLFVQASPSQFRDAMAARATMRRYGSGYR